jgi:hypothetical protein
MHATYRGFCMLGPRATTFALHALITFCSLAATSLWAAHGHTAVVSDLPQDYASARAWLDGGSPYAPLAELIERYGFGKPPTR